MKKIISLLLITASLVTFNLQGAFAKGIKEMDRLIEGLEVGEPVYYENLTIVPVYSKRSFGHTGYATLDESLKNGWLEITELSGGSVPKVRLTNRSRHYVYIMGGEILTGCKQDRIVGGDILIGPKSKNIIIPVYCVEAGRWTAQSDKFGSKSNLGTYDLRREAQKCEAQTQSNIWGRIYKNNEELKVLSATGAYQDAYEDETVKNRLASYERKMRNVPHMHEDTIGVVIGIGDQVISADVFANSNLFKKLWPKLLKSSALSAISADKSGRPLTQEAAARFLMGLHDKDYAYRSGIEEGMEISTSDNEINAKALMFRNTIIHLAAFPGEDEEDKPGSRDSRLPVIIK